MTAAQAILKGIAGDGGLFVPEAFPDMSGRLAELAGLEYKALAIEILRGYLTDFAPEELADCVERAYDQKFDTPLIAPLAACGGYNFLELYHGATLAFKDMALSILPYFMLTALKKTGSDSEIVILTATSGDTGKAALESFAGVKGVRIAVFFPEEGVSEIQKLQMTTQTGSNVHVIGIYGNFDDAQTGLKAIFSDAAFDAEMSRRGYTLSSANSINIGRLLPQVVYYFWAYAQLVRRGDIRTGQEINFTVPTGNFGNILAGYYARRMGLPVGKLICASNSNKVLYDFFRTGEYDKNREFVVTSSPSMDILVSSNLERLLYHIENDPVKVGGLMQSLNAAGRYDFPSALLGSGAGSAGFIGFYADEDETREAIKAAYDAGYLIDPHTAVAFACYKKYAAQTGNDTPNVILSTASPYKFVQDVARSVGLDCKGDMFDLAGSLAHVSGTRVPQQLLNLKNAPVLHNTKCAKTEIRGALERIFLE